MGFPSYVGIALLTVTGGLDTALDLNDLLSRLVDDLWASEMFISSFSPSDRTSSKAPAYLDNWNAAQLQTLDLMIYDFNRFFNGVECVVDLDFIQLNGKSFAGQILL
ncbi:hypothetical protein Tco_0506471 [Tanacetum coccineum]